MFGGGSKTQTSQSWNEPWGPAQPHLGDIMKESNNLYYGGPKGIYEGPRVAGTPQQTTQALNQTMSIAGQRMPGLSDALHFNRMMSGNAGMTRDMRSLAGHLSPIAQGQDADNPYLQDMIASSNAKIGAQQAAMAAGSGRFGSGAHTAVATKAMADAANPVLASAYENAKNRQLQAGGLLSGMYSDGAGRAMQAGAALPGLNNLRYDGASRMAGVGDYYRGVNQQNIDANMQKHNEWLNQPWDMLGKRSAIVNGMGSLGGSSTAITPKNSPSAAQGILGGAAMGAGIGSKIPGIGGGWGALGGGILGAWG
jgi:hypothetical protein